jgi:hypothetical protein
MMGSIIIIINEGYNMTKSIHNWASAVQGLFKILHI